MLYLLSHCKFATAGVLDAKQSHDRVDNHQSKWSTVLNDGRCSLLDDFDLLVTGVDSGEQDVVEDVVRIQSVLLCDFFDSFRSESTLGVNVDNAASTASLTDGQL